MDKSPETYTLATYAGVVGLALLTGITSYLNSPRYRQAGISFVHLLSHVLSSVVAGLITFWGGEALGLSPLVTAICVALAGHTGGSAIGILERVYLAKLEQIAEKTGIYDNDHKNRP